MQLGPSYPLIGSPDEVHLDMSLPVLPLPAPHLMPVIKLAMSETAVPYTPSAV